jgi:hypothetical protein
MYSAHIQEVGYSSSLYEFDIGLCYLGSLMASDIGLEHLDSLHRVELACKNPEHQNIAISMLTLQVVFAKIHALNKFQNNKKHHTIWLLKLP